MMGYFGTFFLMFFLSFSVSGQMLQSEISSLPESKETKPKPPKKNNSARFDRRSVPSYRLTLFKHKRNREQQQRLLPNAADSLRYQGFLGQPKTGLIKLVDDLGCDSNAYVLRADEECLNTIPGGSFYSFRKSNYSSSALADIRLKDGLLVTDGIFSQNLMVKLGDIPLESVTLTTEGMKFLRDFVPETETKSATKQYAALTRGITENGFEYIKILPAIADTTYAMRLVAYRGKLMRVSMGFIYNVLSEDDRSDLIVAFRIIRKENGMATLLWKELERKKAPKIKVRR